MTEFREPLPIREPIALENGKLSPVWARWFAVVLRDAVSPDTINDNLPFDILNNAGNPSGLNESETINRISDLLQQFPVAKSYNSEINELKGVIESLPIYVSPQELDIDDSPVFVTIDLSGITDGNIPYISTTGFADSPVSTDGSDTFVEGNLRLTTNNTLISIKDSGGTNVTLLYLNGSDNLTIGSSTLVNRLYLSCSDNMYISAGAAKELHLRQDTTSRLMIDANGRVGIGTSTPSKLLDVNGDISLEAGSGDYYSNDGSQGWTGAFTNGDGDTVTVKNGIITDVS